MDHPTLVEDYRLAHEATQRGHSDASTTEGLRVAFVAYRNLFAQVLDEQDPDQGEPDLEGHEEPEIDLTADGPHQDENGSDQDENDATGSVDAPLQRRT